MGIVLLVWRMWVSDVALMCMPECRWQCSDPVCETSCQVVCPSVLCENVQCSFDSCVCDDFTEASVSWCETPALGVSTSECEVSSLGVGCVSENNSSCACEASCVVEECYWSCEADITCPRPSCELICESSSCAWEN
jgi:hypothetical protein